MTPPGHRPGALIVTVPFAPFHTRRPAATKIFPGPLPIGAPSLITLKANKGGEKGDVLNCRGKMPSLRRAGLAWIVQLTKTITNVPFASLA